MVGSMNDIAARAASRRRLLAALALFAAMPASTALAAELPDPTRPPATRRASPSAAAAPALVAATPVLQSVLIGDGRKPSAIISGRMLTLGDPFDDMRLTGVTEAGALLSGPHGPTALTLTPNSAKQVALATPAERLAPATPTKQLAAAARAERLAAAAPVERLAAAAPATSGRRLGPASVLVPVGEQK